MAGFAVFLGSLLGGAAVGGALYHFDPLRLRQPLSPAGEPDILAWSQSVFNTRATVMTALAMLGYEGESAVGNFQKDMNYVLAWEREKAGGNEKAPPASAGFVHRPPALDEVAAAPDLAMTNSLDQGTVAALAQAVRGAVFATGKVCMTEAGEVMEADTESCRQAWQEAVRYAYQAMTPPLGAGAPAQPVILQYVPYFPPEEKKPGLTGSYSPFGP